MSFQSGDAFRPIADKQKYLTDYKQIHNTGSYLTGYGFTKGKNLNNQNKRGEKKPKNQQDDFVLTVNN